MPVLTLRLPSTRNQWKLFFSLATGCWAGLGWAGLAGVSRTLAVKFAALLLRWCVCCVRGSVAETAVDLKNGKIPHFCRQQIPGPGAACRDADLNGISPA